VSNDLIREVWDTLYKRIGEDLRVVTRYGPGDYETIMRDDVRRQYTDREDQQIVDEAIVDQLSLRREESVFKTGGMKAIVRVFDDAWVMSWPDSLGGKSGFIVSIQRGGDVATMDDVEYCIRFIDDEIAPAME
jgi:hypothetical protein